MTRLDVYCGSQFWNTSHTWNTTDPDLTICFEKTVLLWIPCLFLWTFSFVEAYFIKNSKNRDIPWNWLNVSKFLLVTFLIILSAIDLFVSSSNEIVHEVDIYTPIIKLFSFILYAILVHFERKNGLHTSGILFIFWLLLFVCGAFQFRTEIRETSHQGCHYSCISYLIYYPVVFLMFLLNCSSDKCPRKIFYPKSKNPCPEEEASVFSKLLFSWTFPLLRQGIKKPLEHNDLWDVRPKLACREISSVFGRHWKKELLKVKRPPINENEAHFNGNVVDVHFNSKKQEASVFWVLCKAFGPSYLSALLIKFILDILVFVNPTLLKWLIGFAKEGHTWKGYFYTALLFLAGTLQVIVNAQYLKKLHVVGIKTRSSLISAIYRKTLKISNVSKKEKSVGEIVNLMSVDANKFRDLPEHFSSLIFSPFQMVIALYFLWNILGPSVLAGVIVMVTLIPLNGYLLNIEKRFHVRQMKNKDERVKLMNEILNGIKVLKLYGWEPSFEKQVLNIRSKELKVLKQTSYLDNLIFFIWNCAPFLVSLVTFSTYVLVDEKNVLDVETAFVSIVLFDIMRLPMSLFPILLNFIIQGAVSLKRINDFLNAEELDSYNVTHDKSEGSPLVIENGTFSWGEISILKNINVRLEINSLTAVVGAVGAGKSSLISAFLGEMKKQSGRVNTIGSIAYVPQQAWIQNASLRDNILFGKSFDKSFYDEVISACALMPDIEMLPAGDETEIGEKGINLSGGQKQRVSLARAVYSDCDIYLLDDPLSAVDSHVGKHLFEKIIGQDGLLKNKTRLLVTHNIVYLPQTHKILVVKDGEISENGTYQQLLDKKGAFSEFLIQYLTEAEDNETDLDQLKNQINEEESLKQLNKIFQRHISYVSESNTTDKDYLSRQKLLGDGNIKSSFKDKNDKNIIETEKSETGSVKWTVYKHYIKSAGFIALLGTLFTDLLYQGFSIGSMVWLTVWSNDSTIVMNNVTNIEKRDMYICVYGAMGLGQSITSTVGSLIFRLAFIHAAKVEHSKLLHSCMRWPLSFFDTTPLGRILNRFSSDVDVMDNVLSSMMRQFIKSFLGIIGIVVVICTTTPIFASIVIPVGLLYYILQKFFVATSRQLKRLESASQSPIYSHFGETIGGVHSIRAYNAESRFINQFENRIDHNLIFQYPNIMTNRWAMIRLEMIGNIVILFAALFAVIKNKDEPGVIGLSMSYALQITLSLNWMVRLAIYIETNIVSVERIKGYCNFKQEAQLDNPNIILPKRWPQFGVVEFKNYSVRYRSGLDLVLKNINFTINAKEKVGIVGRTGAGKSSLTLSLFRIIEAAEGQITIDGINILKIGLHALRSCLTIIPQDAVLFSGSLRINLDPFDKYTDDQIWQALQHSHLDTFVKGLSAGLNHEITEGGDNLSAGQKQLICLSRALLRKTKVLILDEATASVDLETDDLIQKTIRAQFNDCTILTIAHRINTIMDSDRIIVLDKGQISEFDSPQNLLLRKQSIFYSMCKDAGLV